MSTSPRFDLRRGVTKPVMLVISRRRVENIDIASVLTELKPFLATREDAWLYRNQMALVVMETGSDFGAEYQAAVKMHKK